MPCQAFRYAASAAIMCAARSERCDVCNTAAATQQRGEWRRFAPGKITSLVRYYAF